MGLTDSNYVVNSNTRLYYKLNGNSNDSSWNWYNGTDSNISYTSGRFWQCASFNGTSSCIRLVSSLINNSNTLTCVVWAKATWAADQFDWKIFDIRNWTNQFVIFRENSWWYKFSINFGTLHESSSFWYYTNERHCFGLSVYWWTAYYYIDWVLKWSWGVWTTNWTNSDWYIWTEWNNSINRHFNGYIDECIVESVWRTEANHLEYYEKSKEKFFWEYLSSWKSITKGVRHLNGIWEDDSWNWYFLTESNVSWSNGVLWQSAYFNWSSAYLTKAYSNDLDFWTWDFTISFWMNPSRRWWGLTQWVIGKKYTDANNGWRIFNKSSDNQNVLVFRWGGTSDFYSSTNVSVWVWQHWVLTRVWSTVKWYLNWNLNNTWTNSNNISENYPFYIWYAPAWGWYYQWYIDEVFINKWVWMSAKDIKRYYTMIKWRFGIV